MVHGQGQFSHVLRDHIAPPLRLHFSYKCNLLKYFIIFSDSRLKSKILDKSITLSPLFLFLRP